jgi:hypothetical protein
MPYLSLMNRFFPIVLTCLAMAGVQDQYAQTNYDESKVPAYLLPGLLDSGSHSFDVGHWEKERGPEILSLFEDHVYGRTPHFIYNQEAKELWRDTSALEGKATFSEFQISLTTERGQISSVIFVAYPNNINGLVPFFEGLNFYGNQTITDHADVGITSEWVNNNEELGISEHRATEQSRGARMSRWPIDQIIARGYGLACAYYGDFDPDFDDGFKNGVHGIVPGTTVHGDKAWGAIGAWAWGLSRILDFLEVQSWVDKERVIAIGHSRLGKAALWAGAQDQRFAAVISNNSGCGGAALFRRMFGETAKAINTNFPHWFSTQFKSYNDREENLPVDQHQLLALIAPRPIYVASASEDPWADPKGEFLALRHTGWVFSMYGKQTIPDDARFPSPGGAIHSELQGYHLREGAHDLTGFDWKHYIDFLDKAWFR